MVNKVFKMEVHQVELEVLAIFLVSLVEAKKRAKAQEKQSLSLLKSKLH
jgi:hypothetical protein